MPATTSLASGVKPGGEWPMIEAVLAAPIPGKRVLLYGPPGTGKTTIGNRYGEPERVYNVYLTDETPAAELRGHFVPQGGEWLWMDGPAIRAWKEGARLVINEVNNASGDALDFLLAVLDDPEIAGIDLPTGERVTPRAGFEVVATMNGEPGDLPEALADRFAVSFNVRRAHPDATKALGDLAHVARAHADAGGGESSRPWNAFRALREHVGEEVAAYAVFGQEAQAILDAIRLRAAHVAAKRTTAKAAAK